MPAWPREVSLMNPVSCEPDLDPELAFSSCCGLARQLSRARVSTPKQTHCQAVQQLKERPWVPMRELG